MKEIDDLIQSRKECMATVADLKLQRDNASTWEARTEIQNKLCLSIEELITVQSTIIELLKQEPDNSMGLMDSHWLTEMEL